MDSIPDFFDKLMIAKEMKFDQGSIRLFGHSVVLPPAKLFSEYIRLVGNDPKYTDILYESARVSFREGMGKDLQKRFAFNIGDFFNWLPRISGLAGWGSSTITQFIPEKRYGIIITRGSPVVEELRGSVHGPVDHVLRGFITGSTESMYGIVEGMTTVEVECENDGYKECKFIFNPEMKEVPNDQAKK